MNFIEFCAAHGVIVDRPPRLGVWERFPTQTHPKKRNGSVKWMGDYGFCQDHAVHTEVIFWREDRPVKIDPRVIHAAVKQAEEERQRLQQNAAMRASLIINRCVIGCHDYFRKKGFPKEKGLIWCHDQTEHLVIPMRDEKRELVGMQTIDADGQKKFLYGQKTRGANFVIGNGPTNVLCEGFATGLSVREAMRHLKQNWTIYICFSAHNLLAVAERLRPGLVVADNDASGTGEKMARQTGWKYWMSEKVGEDFNDAHQREGIFTASRGLWNSLYPRGRRHVRGSNNFHEAIRARQFLDDSQASLQNNSFGASVGSMDRDGSVAVVSE